MIFFVPARRGSVRLPGKNTSILRGRPMIEWTFDAAKDACGFGDRVIVSTDDDVVAGLARARGFKVLARPEHLCESGARMNDVIAHHAKDFIFRFQHGIVVLYPTSPLRTSAHIRSAIESWSHSPNTDRIGLMSVSPVTHRPVGLMSVDDVGLLRMNQADGATYYRRQDMPDHYRANGAIYVLPMKAIRDGKVDAQ